MSITIREKKRLKEVYFTFHLEDYLTGLKTFKLLKNGDIRGISTSNIVAKSSFSIHAQLEQLDLISSTIEIVQKEARDRLSYLKSLAN